MRRRGEDGYAMVAAVASIAVFAGLALTMIDTTRATMVTAAAEFDRARAAAAADAGLAIAIKQLLSTDPATRWSLDDRVRTVGFDGARLAIRIEDERGKVPINIVEEDQLRILLSGVGLQDERLRVAVDSLMDWRDEDDEARPDGAEIADYRQQRIAPRNGPLLSVGELARVRGFDAATVAKLAPIVTVNFGSGPFDARHASPLAINVMNGEDADSVAAIERGREIAGQRTAIDLASGNDVVGRPLTVRVLARLPDGARATRAALIEITGAEARPYVIRSYE